LVSQVVSSLQVFMPFSSPPYVLCAKLTSVSSRNYEVPQFYDSSL